VEYFRSDAAARLRALQFYRNELGVTPNSDLDAWLKLELSANPVCVTSRSAQNCADSVTVSGCKWSLADILPTKRSLWLMCCSIHWDMEPQIRSWFALRLMCPSMQTLSSARHSSL